MKKLLIATLLCTNAHAVIFNTSVVQQNFHCTPKRYCDVYGDYDVSITNENGIPEHYNILYSLELPEIRGAVNTSGDSITVQPGQTITKHYHHRWLEFVLDKSNAYQLKSSISVMHHPETMRETMSTIWVY